MFEDANRIALNSNRVTLLVRDLRLLRNLTWREVDDRLTVSHSLACAKVKLTPGMSVAQKQEALRKRVELTMMFNKHIDMDPEEFGMQVLDE